MPETTSIYAQPRASTQAPSAQYAVMEAGGLYFLTNFYGAFTPSELDQSNFIEWQAETSGNEGSGSPGFRFRQNLIGPAKLRYRIIGKQTTHVRAYPSLMIGTEGGRYDTSGRISGDTGILMAGRRMLGTSFASDIWDLKAARSLTGYPCRVDQMPDTTARWDVSRATAGVENYFFDFYLSDVSDTTLYTHNLPSTPYNATRLPDPSLAYDLNGVNSHYTRAWNLNIWPALPVVTNSGSTRPDGGWGGGVIVDDIGGLIEIDGRQHHMIFKRESQGSLLEFDYIGLVFANEELSGELNVKAYRDWLVNDFPALLQSSAKIQSVWNLARVKPWGQPRMPAADMIWERIQFGNELWYSADSGTAVAELDYTKFEIDVDGIGVFGFDHTPDTGAGTGGSNNTNGTDLGYELTINVGEIKSFDYTDIHTSGSQITSQYTESNSTRSTIVGLEPRISVRGDAEGTNVFSYTLENGETGQFTVITKAVTTDSNDTNSGGNTGTTGSSGNTATSSHSIRTLQPGSKVIINLDHIPNIDKLNNRQLQSKSGAAAVSISDDGRLLTIEIPQGAERGTGGTIEIK